VRVEHVRRSSAAYGLSAGRYLAEVGSAVSERFEADADLDVLARIAQMATASGGRTLDAGCGTGRVARWFADAGCDAVGIDVAEGMVEVARSEHPDLSFVVGELARLRADEARFDAAAYWYSIITTPPDELGSVWAEMVRVLVPGGVAVIAFQSGSGTAVERPNAYGTGVDLTLYRHDAVSVIAGLDASGLDIADVIERAPILPHEDTAQTFIVACA
jgi:SAM-dependent methyltransferase